MVVKGTKNLKHCALLDPSPNPDQLDPWEDDVSAQGKLSKELCQKNCINK